MNILFVDDSEAIIIEMKRILEETDHEMVVARDGGQGLAELAIRKFDISGCNILHRTTDFCNRYRQQGLAGPIWRWEEYLEHPLHLAAFRQTQFPHSDIL